MNNMHMAQDHIAWAYGSLEEAKEALAKKDFPRTVRRAQECIELSIKAFLRALGIEFPKEHDVSDAILGLKVDLPLWFKESIQRMADIMQEITSKRGPAMYGYEREMKPSGEIFTQEDAEKALEDANFVYQCCNRFLKEWFRLSSV